MDPLTTFLIQVVIAIVMMAISYAITASMSRRAPAQKPAAMEDFDFPQDAEGTTQAVIFGDVWTEDWMVLWYGDYKITPIKKKGGKK